MNSIRETFKGRDLLSLHDFTPQQIAFMLDYAAELKQMQKQGEPHALLQGQTLGMIFQKSSTRTRVSFEVGMYQLGGHALFLSSNDIQLGRGESIADTGRVLGRYVDGIMIRTFAQSDVEELAEYAPVPVINGLTDLLHPCQILADLLTIKEHKGRLAGLKLAYVGDGNNICHSLLYGCAKTGLNISVASPEGYLPREEIVAAARQDARETGASITITTNPEEAVTGADVLVTDVWASMGQESEQQARVKVFAPYQINARLAALAAPDYIFLHCLPAHRGEEVAAEIIDGPHAVVFDEAENRLHAQKAVMALLMVK
ncbi:ornithine carbamoyltransferase [Desulfallas thermosapovorans]|uniref:Ornithine carbamoyltransferase n=1 Tax=Desulfallas thermosapovorans DSM 6562 TaxID=1121431 RepID=A0A5S4ZNQ1_9FIRM|nr:ornithine carbamoyltransferase [Desulfallas thermosapovorans]TYO94443.1 ornithine carbamoyltransferase [Desulfallas thermosapovorans DSM 6562]